MNIPGLIEAVQRELGLDDDGLAGPLTWKAIYRRVMGKEWGEDSPSSLIGGMVDARSERLIATLHENVRPYARALLHKAAQQGITLIVTSGTRTYAEQDALFNKRPPVTKARGGHSNHNFGIAFDVTIFEGGVPVWESPLYKAVGSMGKSLGLSWGGDWKSFVDEPHFELRPKWAEELSENEMLAELRSRHDSNKDAFA